MTSANPEITVYLGLGSNLGDRKENIKAALEMLERHPQINLIRYSSVYLTEAIDNIYQPDFYNCAAIVKTALSPPALFKAVKAIEYAIGREPNSHFQPRPIDIDILLYGDLEIDLLDLVIPHARLTKRTFVLLPLGIKS